MEIGVSIIATLVDMTISPIVRQVGYILHYKENIRTLLLHVEKLKADSNRVQHEIISAERRGEEIHRAVLLWLTEVDKFTSIIDELLAKEQQANMQCLHCVLPNLSVRRQLSRKSVYLLMLGFELSEKGRFPTISSIDEAEDLVIMSTEVHEASESRSPIIQRILNELTGRNTNKIGLYGFGGVGKTTLVEEVVRRVIENELFEDVVMVRDVKKMENPERLQKEIAEKLGIEVDANETTSIKARKICARVKNKKALIVFDDVWSFIDLEEVGLPSVATCKVLLISRSREVLVQMGSQMNFPLDLLSQNESWSLFERKAGDVMEDPKIRKVAGEVAKRCRGLPLLIVMVAGSLRQCTLAEWKDANRHLKQNAHLAIEWSYGQLNSGELQMLFLLCGVIAWKNSISLNDLFKYVSGLGMIKSMETLEDARNYLLSSVIELQGLALLLDDEDNMHVKMHDLVYDVAIHIASRDHNMLSVADGAELKQWPDKDFFARCRCISLSSNNIPALPQVLECKELEMFFLRCEDGRFIKIATNFFDKMSKLKVLGIQNLRTLSPLPSLVCLKSLTTLCLDNCVVGNVAQIGELSNLEVLSFVNSNIQQLPEEIGQLNRLRLLDLTDCFNLKLISPNVISGMSRLEDLRMRNVFLEWEADDCGVRSNAYLSELKQLPRLAALEVEIPDPDVLPKDFFVSLKLSRYHVRIGSNRRRSPVVEEETTINTLHLEFPRGSKWERHKDDLPSAIGIKVMLPNLTTLVIHRCNGLYFICSSFTARRFVMLKRLEITECEVMEEIVHMEQDDEETTDMFPLLQHLKLKGLHKLARFCSATCIKFPALENLQLEMCINLESFIFNPISKSSGNEGYEMIAPCSLFDRKVDFPKLETLTIKDLPSINKIWDSQLGTTSFCRLRKVTIQQCNSLQSFLIQVLLANLSSLVLHQCSSLRYICSTSTARLLNQLKHIEVAECEMMEEIVSSEQDGEENIDGMFPLLQHLQLKDLPKLAKICSGTCIKFPALENLQLETCVKLESFIFNPISESSGNENPETFAPRTLFNKKVDFPKLETLTIKDLPSLNKNSDSKLATNSFCKLRKVTFQQCNSLQSFLLRILLANLSSLVLHRCNSLRFICSTSTARLLKQLKHLEVAECEMMEEIVSMEQDGEENTNDMFPLLQHLELKGLPKLAKFCSGTCIKFPVLENLQLETCIKLESFICDPASKSSKIEGHKTVAPRSLFDKKVDFPKLETLTIKDLPSIKKIWNSQPGTNSFCRLRKVTIQQCNSLESFLSQVPLANLSSLVLHRCNSLRFMCSTSTARLLKQLKHLEVAECEKMEVIASMKQVGEENTDDMFPLLQHLELKDLPNLAKFCSGTCVKLPALESLQLEKCIKLESFIRDPMSKSSKIEGYKTVAPCSLFDKKVDFPKLETLTIHDLPSINKIWDSQFATNSFCKLKEATVQQCNSVQFVLRQLAACNRPVQKLVVEKCGTEEEIVAQEQETAMPTRFVFTEVFCMEFKSLPHLYPRMHDFNGHLLKRLVLLDCTIVDNDFDAKVSTLQTTKGTGGMPPPLKQVTVLITKSSFPLLQDLTLRSSNIWYGPPTPAVKAIFPKNTEMPENITTLKLHGMEKLTRLWEENMEPTGQVLTWLDTLEVKFCGLSNRELSAISFGSLTSLEVTCCWRLQYLTTYSVAQSLVLLERLIVDECKMMNEIVACNKTGDVENGEIIFKKLQHLELIDLINMERFCSRHYTVKVPCLSDGTLVVNGCPFKLKITGEVLEEVSDGDIQSLSQNTEAVSPSECASSSVDINQKQSVSNASEVVEIHDDGILSERSNNKQALLVGISEREQEVDDKSPFNYLNTEAVSELPVNSGGDASEVATATALATALCTQVIEASSERNLPLAVPTEPIKMLSSADKPKRFETTTELFNSSQLSQNSQETETAKGLIIRRLIESSVHLLESKEAQYQFKEALEILITQEVIPSAIQTRVITFLKEIREAKESCALATAKLASLKEDIRRENMDKSKLRQAANEGKQFQQKAELRSQRQLKLHMNISSEEEIAQETERRDHEQKLADERLAIVDSLTLEVANYTDRRSFLVECQADKDLADVKVEYLYRSMMQLLAKNLNS